MEKDTTNYGDAVSNAIFHVEMGHWLVQRAVERFAEAFRGNVWASGGPNLVLGQYSDDLIMSTTFTSHSDTT